MWAGMMWQGKQLAVTADSPAVHSKLYRNALHKFTCICKQRRVELQQACITQKATAETQL